MNTIDLANLGGFPLEQDTLKFMQDANIDMIASLAAMLGDKRIVSGVEVVGSNVTDGWITYQGEIIKFIGGAAGAGVVISEQSTDALFEDGAVRPVYKIRTATIGAPATFPFSDLKPGNVGMPTGSVVMWSGAPNAIPKGWALCDGTNGTPNLSGRFIVGYDAADADHDTIGNIGGAKEVVLAKANLPHVKINVTGRRGNSYNGDPTSDDINGSGFNNPKNNAANGQTDFLGDDQPHENRPPYYTLAYIIKL